MLIRVKGAGVCRTDLRIFKGLEARPNIKLPMALGHENAGVVEEVGDEVVGLKKGDRVVVYATWGDGTCRYCREGKFSLCKNQEIPGQTTNGGYSEYLLVPSFKWLIKLETLDPVSASPLADAGTTSMGAVRKAASRFRPGSLVVVYGAGGVALYTIQILKALFSSIYVMAVSRSQARREAALRRGADVAVRPEELRSTVNSLSKGGIDVAFDVVGDEYSAQLLSSSLSSAGLLILVGLEGRTMVLPVFDTVVWEHQVIGSNYGTLNDLSDVVKLAEKGKLSINVRTYSLDEANDALVTLESGEVADTRLVITP
ncbi:alcohol dehydrogenase [Sulfodiicoccus acidiphilus]|uniref:Alcohol dehydrogenase n=1 Tax=Sulfodiicoccus acidiphilus TaxID=1670455 RepID=A0A348B424_9CREN|nr:alcohol dehydrogenase catalytic domain-containing protein [Sulfodiicoccus acidiphilus]BBD72926.1 alcohol dehydrogenase [Sulfodiicoccus acidiphilus]GGT87949.1 alcohol dehydrogenase [Sulfodiicoccus acidiphilus]